ncbi:MAG: SGNH/GDSL hydrolase family protein [Gammaproteobacteria bacterium]
MRIVCFGDSITEGAEFPTDERWTTRLAAHLERRAPGRYRVYNRGVGGETSALALQRYASAVRPLRPSVVLVEYGLNDANVYDWTDQPRVALDRYADNLACIAGWVREDGGRCILIVNHSLGRVRGRQGNGGDYLANFAPYNARVIAVARTLNTPYTSTSRA